MRRKDRELNIFSMSALDLFASTMGAFILITLILMPYYLKEDPPVPEPAEPCPAPTPIPVCPVCPRPVTVPQCPTPTTVEKIVDNLLVVEMEWGKKVDVDLHVKTPDGEYYYGRKTIADKPGKLTLDNTAGGSRALEMWKSYAPTQGTYEVCYKLYSGSGPVQVKGRLEKPTGPVVLPVKTLTSKGEKVCPLKFELNSDYTYREISRG